MIVHSILIALILTAGHTTAQVLAPAQRKALDKAFATWLTATDETRDDAELGLLPHGLAGLDYVDGIATKEEGATALLSDLRGRAAKLLGDDLLTPATGVETREWLPMRLEVNEVLLLRQVGAADSLIALRVAKEPIPAAGKLALEWWAAEGVRRRLTSDSAGRLDVDGVKAAVPFKAGNGFDEYDFDLTVSAHDLRLRFIGPRHFLIRSTNGLEFALSGNSSPDRLKTGDTKLRFWSDYPAEAIRLESQLQAYLFRLLPGCTPLRSKSSEFARFETVQVQVRAARTGGEPLCLVRIRDHRTSGMTANRLALVQRFASRILAIDANHLFIAGGEAATIDGHEYWVDGAWRKPDASLAKFLRTQYSEES